MVAAMSEIQTVLTAVFGSVMQMVGTVADTISEEPILLLFVLIPLIGIGVGLFRRLLNVN